MTQIIFCLSLIVTISITAHAQPTLTFQSAAEQTPLVELYTSEGCSSCPPAEIWLSHLKQSPGLWKDFVPVAFHVDYWDYLGWRDPWSARQFSDRQRDYAGAWHNDSIYTPGLVLNGREWRDWSRGQNELKPSLAKTGVLSVRSTETNHWQINFTPAHTGENHFEIHAALLASGVSSEVKAGENRGRTLVHDFAVLNFTSAALQREGEIFQGNFTLPSVSGAKGRLALAAWVTQAGNLEPLQATGGWMDASGEAH
jgi:hypothetical protein